MFNVIDEAVVKATGEKLCRIRRRGFSLFTQGPVELDPEDIRPPQVIDWDCVDPSMGTRFIDDLID